MMIKYALALALAPVVLLAQDSNEITKVIHVRFGRAEAIKGLIGTGSVSAFANNALRVVVLKGSASSVAAAEEAIKQLDAPLPDELARDVEVTVYVIGAAAQATSEDRATADLAPVIRQLKAVFPYGGYQLLDTMMIRSREGRESQSDGILKHFPSAQNTELDHGYHVLCVLGDRNDPGSDRTVRLERFAFTTHADKSEISIHTDFDLQDGQKVVVGNTNIDGGNSALFVVASAKFVQ
jgi:hypothetical protein